MGIKDRLVKAAERFSTAIASLTNDYLFAHEKIRERFGYIQCSCKIVQEDITAYVMNMGVRIGQIWVDKGGMKMFAELDMHELGHPYYAPGGINNHIRFAKLAAKKMGIPIDDRSLGAVHGIMNYASDILDDTANQDERNGDIEYQTKILYDDFKEVQGRDYSAPEAKAGALLLAYPEYIVGDAFTGCQFPDDVKAAAENSVAIARDEDLTLHEKYDKILDELVPFFLNDKNKNQNQGNGNGPGQPGQGNGPKGKGQQQQAPTLEELEALSDQIKQAYKDANKNPQANVGESLSEDPEAAIMAAIDSGDKDAVKIAGGYMGYGPQMMEKALVKAKARNMLQSLALKGRKPGMPNANKISSQGWSPSMPIGQLNIRDSVRMGGLTIIPGVTTKRDFVYETPGTEKATKLHRMAISVDVSGSMDKDQTILAIYALLLWAVKHGMQAAVNMWSNAEKWFGWSYKIHETLDKLWEKFGCTGGGTSASGLKNLVGKLERGDVLFYITDFATSSEGKAEAKRLLQQFHGMGVRIVFIAMFEYHCADESGFTYYECKSVSDLPKIALKIMDDLN